MTNRGIAKRPLFESRDDVRYFLSRVALEVRARRFEVLSFCVLTTHFHFLVRSLCGELSEGFRRIQNAHSRRFNRRHRRDGALVRGRFFSKPVGDDRYRRTLIRYIDHNPVQAQIVGRARDYEFGSASHYARGEGPPWLERTWVEADACWRLGLESFSSDAYERAFRAPGEHEGRVLAELIERRLASCAEVDPLDDLIGTTPAAVQAWMGRKARLADGHQPGVPVCTLRCLAAAIERDEVECGLWIVESHGKLEKAREAALVGLARELAGVSWRELAEYLGASSMRARRLETLHRRLVVEDLAYAERAGRIGSAAIVGILGA